MKVRAVDDYDGTYIYDPLDWTSNDVGDFDMEISEEDLERYRAYEAEQVYWEKRISDARVHDRIMQTGGYGPGPWNT